MHVGSRKIPTCYKALETRHTHCVLARRVKRKQFCYKIYYLFNIRLLVCFKLEDLHTKTPPGCDFLSRLSICSRNEWSRMACWLSIRGKCKCVSIRARTSGCTNQEKKLTTKSGKNHITSQSYRYVICDLQHDLCAFSVIQREAAFHYVRSD